MGETRKYKVTILSRSFSACSNEPLELLNRYFEVNLQRNDLPEDTRRIARLIGDSDGIITGSDVVDRYVMDHCPNLKMISKHGVGLDSIDLELAKERGIKVTTTPNANNESVADLTLLLMLNILRQLRRNEIHCDTPDWTSKSLANDLYEKTVALIGFGNIGQAVAHRLQGFSCKLLIYDPCVEPGAFAQEDAVACSFEEALRHADIISLHLPLTEKTQKMINRDTISLMKPEAVLINTSRGGIVDEDALYEALVSRRIRAAGLDVYAQEPPVGNRLLVLDNVVATPHIATHTQESNYRMGVAAARNLIDFFSAYEKERN
ncbi:phosphoglycerate dehydrogenase [Anaerotruncus rubiinfantis]|uniref:phosphoglycerate dehydrogenase n=1 Tax=Anaerotruncus rubiinfantis TaxID=1720200 RepID=UPI00082D5F0F|nr:phosphoglycerate dehydrogenase [Anaerotruncus rubiinfantis]